MSDTTNDVAPANAYPMSGTREWQDAQGVWWTMRAREGVIRLFAWKGDEDGGLWDWADRLPTAADMRAALRTAETPAGTVKALIAVVVDEEGVVGATLKGRKESLADTAERLVDYYSIYKGSPFRVSLVEANVPIPVPETIVQGTVSGV